MDLLQGRLEWKIDKVLGFKRFVEKMESGIHGWEFPVATT
jgi:hypothetical protein